MPDDNCTPPVKRCKKCGEVKPLDAFRRSKATKDGRANRCKSCVRAYEAELYAANPEKFNAKSKAYQQRNAEAISEQKRAYYQENRAEILAKSKAYQQKNTEAIAEYQRAYRQENRTTLSEQKRSYRQVNRAEILAKKRAYRQANQDTLAAKQRAYYQENRDAVRATIKAHYEANRDVYLARNKAHYEANKDRYRENCRRWIEQNPERAKLNYTRGNRKRRARKAGNQYIPYTIDQLTARLAYYGNRCYLCGKPGVEIDHVKPVAKGGPEMLANLRPICVAHNRRKHARWPYPPVFARRTGNELAS